jgi:Zn finger protein HypA/HybF involved in hydrogenase expression
MRQVVRMVRSRVDGFAGARPRIVRLRVSVRSHLAHEDEHVLRTAFQAAAQGTPVEGAMLELIRVPVAAHCSACGVRSDASPWRLTCPACGAGSLGREEVPEVVLHEIVVE